MAILMKALGAAVGDTSSQEGILLEDVCVYLGMATNVVTILAFICATWGAIWAGRRFLRERAYDQMLRLYSLTNDVFRQGMTIQKAKKESKQYELQPLIDSGDALKNWYYDNRFLFDTASDQTIGRLMQGATVEMKEIAPTGCMDKLQELRAELERRLAKPA